MLAVTALSGCMQDLGEGTVSRFLSAQPDAHADISGETKTAVPNAEVVQDVSPLSLIHI